MPPASTCAARAVAEAAKPASHTTGRKPMIDVERSMHQASHHL